jgi:hypothetical protein
VAYPSGWSNYIKFRFVNNSSVEIADAGVIYLLRASSTSRTDAIPMGATAYDHIESDGRSLRITLDDNTLLTYAIENIDSTNKIITVRFFLSGVNAVPRSGTLDMRVGYKNAGAADASDWYGSLGGDTAAPTAPAAINTPSNGFAHGGGLKVLADNTWLGVQSNQNAVDPATVSQPQIYTWPATNPSGAPTVTNFSPTGTYARARPIENCVWVKKFGTHVGRVFVCLYNEAEAVLATGTWATKVFYNDADGSPNSGASGWTASTEMTTPFANQGVFRPNCFQEKSDGTLYLSFYGNDNDGSKNAVYVLKSTDDGATWTQVGGIGSAGTKIAAITNKDVNEHWIGRFDDTHWCIVCRDEGDGEEIRTGTSSSIETSFGTLAAIGAASSGNFHGVTPSGEILPNGFALTFLQDRTTHEVCAYISRSQGAKWEFHTALAPALTYFGGGSGNCCVALSSDNATITCVWTDGADATPTSSKNYWVTVDWHYICREVYNDFEAASIPSAFTLANSPTPSIDTTHPNSPTRCVLLNKTGGGNPNMSRYLRRNDETKRVNCAGRRNEITIWAYLPDTTGGNKYLEFAFLVNAGAADAFRCYYGSDLGFGTNVFNYFDGGGHHSITGNPAGTPNALNRITWRYDVDANTCEFLLNGISYGTFTGFSPSQGDVSLLIQAGAGGTNVALSVDDEFSTRWMTSRISVDTISSEQSFSQTFNQNVSVSVSESLSFSRQVGKIISLTDSIASAVLRQTAKVISLSASESSTITRGIGRQQAVSADASSSSSIGRQAGKVVSDSAVAAVSVVKSVGKAVAVTAQAPSSSLQVGKAFLHTLSASITEVATMAHQAAKVMSVAPAATLSFTRQVGKKFVMNNNVIVVATLLTPAAYLRTLSNSVGQTAALTAKKAFLATMSIAVTSVSSLSVPISKTMSVGVSASLSVGRGIAKLLSLSVGRLATLIALGPAGTSAGRIIRLLGFDRTRIDVDGDNQ